MERELADDIGKLIIRITLAVLILFHGVNKVINGLDGITDLLIAAGLPVFFAYGAYLGEVLGPLLLIAGWYARAGAGLIAINMLFALALAHSDQFLQLNDVGGWQLELQGMYLLTAVALVLTGPGRFAVDDD